MSPAATKRPKAVVGTTSPYPIVVTVSAAHQIASPKLGKSCGSAIRMSAPHATVITAIVKNMYGRMRPVSRARSDRRMTHFVRRACTAGVS
jgi:hypothetical protein